MGLVATMLAFTLTARLDRMDDPSAWQWGWTVLIVVAVPALLYRWDWLYRSFLTVWTFGTGMFFLLTYGTVWWPLVMMPFAWVGAVLPVTAPSWSGYLRITGAVVAGAALVPVTVALVPPAEGRVAAVCLEPEASGVSDRELFSTIRQSPAVWSIWTTYAHGQRVLLVELDRYSDQDDEAQATEAIRGAPNVASVSMYPSQEAAEARTDTGLCG